MSSPQTSHLQPSFKDARHDILQWNNVQDASQGDVGWLDMWRRTPLGKQQWRPCTAAIRYHSTKPVIEIENGTFYRQYPSSNVSNDRNPALFPGLTYVLPNGTTSNAPGSERQYWSVISPSSVARTTFLQVLAGQHICISPTNRRYPALSDIGISPQHAIKYVGFDADRGSSVGGNNVRGAYLSARYESRREEEDYTVLDYLTGHTELNAMEQEWSSEEDVTLAAVTQQLNLGQLLSMPVSSLSNGQTRRARIAKALMDRPEVLLLDGPFMGLDPNTLVRLSKVLQQLAEKNQPRLVISLRPEDGIPVWISHLVVVNEQLQVADQGAKHKVLGRSKANFMHSISQPGQPRADDGRLSRDGCPRHSPPLSSGEALVEMSGVKVAYGDKVVLGQWQQQVDGEDKPGLWWSLHRGQRCGIFGPNGSGKTTMLSLITSDHPQTYSLPIKLFGRSRLPGPGQPGISLFDIQRRMGHSSPEVHAFFPRHLTVRKALESAWADAPMAKATLNDDARQRADACLRWFARELHPGVRGKTMHEKQLADDAAEFVLNGEDIAWAKDMLFGELSFSAQRLTLFLRAIVASPDLVILDEAFSGMDEAVRDKALLFLSQGERIIGVAGAIGEPSAQSKLGRVVMEGLSPEQALLVISHSKEDVPGCIREWICLPEPGEGRPPRTGSLSGPLELSPSRWDEIWGKDV